MTQVKGTALVSTLRFIQESFGAEGMNRISGALAPEDRAVVEGDVLISAWYPFALMLRVMRQTHAIYGGQRPRLYREMGWASAEYAMTNVYRIFFKLGSPQFTLSRAPRLFSNYYDTGRFEATVIEKGHAVVELRDFGEPAPEFCERLIGWMQRMTEMTGARDLRPSHPVCVNRGDAYCSFEGYWIQG